MLHHSTCTGTGAGIGTRDQDPYYSLTIDGLVRFQDRIYVPNCSELKKLILREFHVKPYLGHPGYQKTMTTNKKLYYCLNMKKEVVELVPKCLYYQQVKEECKHPGGLLHDIVILEWK